MKIGIGGKIELLYLFAYAEPNFLYQFGTNQLKKLTTFFNSEKVQ